MKHTCLLWLHQGDHRMDVIFGILAVLFLCELGFIYLDAVREETARDQRRLRAIKLHCAFPVADEDEDQYDERPFGEGIR